MEQQQQQQCKKPSVDFKLKVGVRRTFHRNYLPPEIKQDYWYSRADLKRIRNQNRTLIKIYNLQHQEQQQQHDYVGRQIIMNQSVHMVPDSAEEKIILTHSTKSPEEEYNPFFTKRNTSSTMKRLEEVKIGISPTDFTASRPSSGIGGAFNGDRDWRNAPSVGLPGVDPCPRGLERQVLSDEAMTRRVVRSRAIFAVVHHESWQQLQEEHENEPLQLLQPQQEEENDNGSADKAMSRIDQKMKVHHSPTVSVAESIAQVYSSLSEISVVLALERGVSDAYEACNAD